MRPLARICAVLGRNGLLGFGRFVRKSAWARLGLTPARMPFGPGHLQIEISGKCNLKCPFCPRTYSRQGWRNLTLDEYQRIVSSAPGLYSVNLQGFGEPLLNPDWEAMVRWTRSRRIDVGFATNGTLLDERRSQAVLATGLDWLNVSMDGATATTYERNRVGASFDQVVANVRRLAAMNAAAGGRLSLALAYVCMRSNLDEVPAFCRIARDLAVPIVFLAPVMELTAEVPSERLGAGDKARLERLAAEARGRDLEVIIGTWGERIPAQALTCEWPWNKLYVTADGDVTPCCIEEHHTLGNALEKGITAIWNGPEYRALRAGMTSGKPHPICRHNCTTDGGCDASSAEAVAPAEAGPRPGPTATRGG